MVGNPNPLSPMNFVSLGQEGARDLISLPFNFHHLGAALTTSSMLGVFNHVILPVPAKWLHGRAPSMLWW
ncbi:hypothetical protein U9M48_035971 [Paspalum notatum var. saurae]|uniref:Uncharacterized protein n=1 Tax=Paspalum notatum var. saurae TaxID=547442 RepID=A0AAQ3X903_PASNO